MQDTSIAVSGGSVNAWHRPAGKDRPTVVLVHGLTGTSRWWVRVIEHLPGDFGVISLDARGRGDSFEAPPPYDLDTIADDIDRALNHFDLETAMVAGYSMGGWVAALFAERYPGRVDRLLLVDGGFPLPQTADADPDAIIEDIVGPSLARLELQFEDRESFFDYWKAHPALKRHWEDAMRPALDFELAPSEKGYVVRINPEAVREGARQITVDPKTRDAGSRVEVPTHLIVVERGTADQEGGMIPLGVAEEAATAMHNLTMGYLPVINHYTLLLGAGASAVAASIVR